MTRIKCRNVQIGSNYVLPLENGLKEEETKLEQMIKAAELKRQQLISDGQKKSDEIIAQAQQLVEQAKIECSALIEAAKAEAQQASDEIRETARKEGYETGYKQGYDDGTKSLEEKFNAIEIFAKSQHDIKHNIIKSAELDIVDLVTEIARKVCKKSLDSDIEVLKSITVEAIKQLKDKENITITINPELAEKIYSISDKLKEEIPKLQSIRIIEDANVSADGTIVETPLSRVDCRLKTQIDQIADKMMSKHYSTIEDEENIDENAEIEVSIIDEAQIETQKEVEVEQLHVEPQVQTDMIEPQIDEGLINDSDVQ